MFIFWGFSILFLVSNYSHKIIKIKKGFNFFHIVDYKYIVYILRKLYNLIIIVMLIINITVQFNFVWKYTKLHL